MQYDNRNNWIYFCNKSMVLQRKAVFDLIMFYREKVYTCALNNLYFWSIIFLEIRDRIRSIR